MNGELPASDYEHEIHSERYQEVVNLLDAGLTAPKPGRYPEVHIPLEDEAAPDGVRMIRISMGQFLANRLYKYDLTKAEIKSIHDTYLSASVSPRMGRVANKSMNGEVPFAGSLSSDTSWREQDESDQEEERYIDGKSLAAGKDN